MGTVLWVVQNFSQLSSLPMSQTAGLSRLWVESQFSRVNFLGSGR
jgi:hypothetical protein